MCIEWRRRRLLDRNIRQNIIIIIIGAGIDGTCWKGMSGYNDLHNEHSMRVSQTVFFFIVNIIFAGQCEHWFAPYVLCCCWSHYLWARVLSLIPCLSMCMCAGVVLLLRFDYLDANTHRSLENIWRSNTLIVPNCVARRIQFESLFILNAAVHQASSMAQTQTSGIVFLWFCWFIRELL